MLSPATIPSSTAADRSVDDWLTIDQAASLTGVPARTLRWRCENQWSKLGLAELRPPPSGRGKDIWWLSRLADRSLSSHPTPAIRNQRARNALLLDHSATQVDRAYRRAHWLARWRTLCAADRRPDKVLAAVVVDEAKQREGQEFLISVRSLHRWRELYNNIAQDGRIAGVAGLIDQSRGRAVSGDDVSRPSRSPEGVAYFYALYHTQANHSIKTCHDATVDEAKRHDWNWPSTVRATQSWLQAHDQLAVTCAHRDPSHFRHVFMAHLDRDTSDLPVARTYVFDHARLDFWCLDGTDKIRPWLTGIMDQRSRCLVGWHIGPVPHSDAIISAMRMAFRDWAICERAYLDNGSDFCSTMISGPTKKERRRYRKELGPDWRTIRGRNLETFWSGIFAELGVDITYALPRSPWSKMIERAFGTMHDQFDRTFVTYCGKDSVSRPECLAKILRGYSDVERRTLKRRHGDEWKKAAVLKLVNEEDIPTLDRVRGEFADYLIAYHNAAHTGESMDGETPLSVWRTADSLRKANEPELLTLLQARGVYRVGPNGVSFQIGGRRTTYGAASGPLRRFTGRDVFITVDPDNCGFCHAYTADARHRVSIGRLEANDRVPADTSVEELRDAIKDVARRRRVLSAAVREAPKRVRNASQELRARRAAKASELRRTGTDDAASPNIVPVRTGFEGVSLPDRTTSRREPDEYDEIDMSVVPACGAPSICEDPDDPYAGQEYDGIDTADVATVNHENDDGDDPYDDVALEDLPVTDDPDRIT